MAVESLPETSPPPAPSPPAAEDAGVSRFEMMPEVLPLYVSTVEHDSFWRSGMLMAVAGVVFVMWACWFLLARVPVRVSSVAARIEVDDALAPVAVRNTGRVMAVHMVLGQAVTKGDVLVELDTKAEQLMVAGQRASAESLASQLLDLNRQLGTMKQSSSLNESALSARIAESTTLLRSAEDAAGVAALNAERSKRLHAQHLLSEKDFAKDSADARQLDQSAQGRRDNLNSLRLQLDADIASHRTALAELEREISRVKGDRAVALSSMARLETTIDDRRTRAPISGRIGNVAANLHVGDVVEPGAVLGTIIPSGSLRAVAQFPAAQAIGRIAPRQRAVFFADGFPYTQFGTLSATVLAVGDEASNGDVRVELSLADTDQHVFPLRHGLSGTVEVEIEQVAPAILVLRSTAGAMINRSARTRTAAPIPQ